MKALIKTLKKTFPIDKLFFHRSCFENRKHYKGFYIDVGIHHPYRFSNTVNFYQNGWRGINIQPTPGVIRLFNIFRRCDININIGIDITAGILPGCQPLST